jgi:hypothetical protein
MVLGSIVLCGMVFAGDYPPWFTGRGIIDPSQEAHDHGPVNQGQVKWIASQAYGEFQQKLPSADLAKLLLAVDSFPAGSNHKPANLGMLKAVATPFYDELIAAGYATGYPWEGGSPADYNLANQGQLKNLFAFDLDVDLDGDGLVDWWAEQHGLGSSGADGDLDNDGISNLDEYTQGSNPVVADSGSYAAESMLVGGGETEPSTSPAVDVAALGGSEVSGTLGTWVLDGSAAYAVSRRGHVEYKANLTEGDIYRFEIGIRQRNIVEAGKSKNYRLRFSVDGQFVKRFWWITLLDDELKTVAIQTPFLGAGDHVVRVEWDNFENDISLRIEHAAFQRYDGTDSDGNGVKDWVENKLIERNTIEKVELVSRTSPVCMEGQALYAGTLQLEGGDKAFPGPDGTWFGNLSLNPDGQPHAYAVSFENGGRTLSRVLQWKPTNILADFMGEPIRKGDALLLVAAPASGIASNGLSRIFVNGEEVVSSSMPQPYTFASNGVHEVRGVYTGLDGNGASVALERTVQVTVVGAEPETIAAMVNKTRPWNRPAAWPEEAVMQLDSRIVQSVDTEGNPTLKNTIAEERYGVVRLGPNGPVLAPVVIKGFNMWFMQRTYLYYDEIFEDGSFTATTTMIISPNIPEVWVDQRCRYGVAYEDGAHTREFHFQDYNNQGEVRIVFFHSSSTPSSVCHYTDVYQGDVMIGRSY